MRDSVAAAELVTQTWTALSEWCGRLGLTAVIEEARGFDPAG